MTQPKCVTCDDTGLVCSNTANGNVCHPHTDDCKGYAKACPSCQSSPSDVVGEAERIRKSCHDTYNGGYRTIRELDIFHHGMETACNVFSQALQAAEQRGAVKGAERLIKSVEDKPFDDIKQVMNAALADIRAGKGE